MWPNGVEWRGSLCVQYILYFFLLFPFFFLFSFRVECVALNSNPWEMQMRLMWLHSNRCLSLCSFVVSANGSTDFSENCDRNSLLRSVVDTLYILKLRWTVCGFGGSAEKIRTHNLCYFFLFRFSFNFTSNTKTGSSLRSWVSRRFFDIEVVY